MSLFGVVDAGVPTAYMLTAQVGVSGGKPIYSQVVSVQEGREVIVDPTGANAAARDAFRSITVSANTTGALPTPPTGAEMVRCRVIGGSGFVKLMSLQDATGDAATATRGWPILSGEAFMVKDEVITDWRCFSEGGASTIYFEWLKRSDEQ